MKKSTKIIIAVVSVLVVAAIVFAILFFATDLFKKKPKDGFYKALDKVTAMEENDINYEDIVSKLNDVKNDSSESNTKITMDLKLKGDNEQANQYLELLKKLEFNIDTKVDARVNTGAVDINVKYDGKDIGTIKAILDSENIGVKFDGITDKYYTVSLDDLKNTANSKISSATSENSSFSSLESQATMVKGLTSKLNGVNFDELVSILDIKNTEISRIINRYKDVLKSTLSDDKYSSEKVKITVAGKSVDATGYTVTLTANDIMKFAKAAVSSMKEDTETLNLLVDKVNKLMEIMGQKNQKISKDNLITLLEGAAQSLNSQEAPSDFTLKITLYEANKDVVRIKAAMKDYAIMIDSVKDGDTTKGALTIKAQDKEITLFTTETTKKGDNKYTLKLATDLAQFKSFNSSIPAGKLEMIADVDGNNVKMKLYADIENVAEATLNIDNTTEFKSVNVEKLTASNSKSAKSITEAEKQEISTKAVGYLAVKMDAIKAIASDLGVSESQLSELISQLGNAKSKSNNTTESTTETSSNASVTKNADGSYHIVPDFSNATIIPAQ